MGLSVYVKLFAIAMLSIVLLLALSLIGGKVRERAELRGAVWNELAATGVAEQRVVAPVLYVPCRERYRAEVDEAGKRRVETFERDCGVRLLMASVNVTSALRVEPRSRGIYALPFYFARTRVVGRFEAPPEPALAAETVERAWGVPEMRIGIADVRGLRGGARLRVGGVATRLQPGTGDAVLGSGVHAPLAAAGWPRDFAFDLAFELGGSGALRVVPTAKTFALRVTANWPHPSFQGRFLPDVRAITAQGFEAAWHTNELASDAGRTYVDCSTRDGKCAADALDAFGFDLVDPVDVYRMAERALDYAFLFVLATFFVFMLFEVLARLRLHPMHYALVGAALAVFFLLLFALSEHAPFPLAYAIAAGACVVLTTWYVASPLGGRGRAAVFGAYLASLYGALFLLLRSEDHAMLLGAVLVFGLLAAGMIGTRRLDWWSVGRRREEEDGAAT